MIQKQLRQPDIVPWLAERLRAGANFDDHDQALQVMEKHLSDFFHYTVPYFCATEDKAFGVLCGCEPADKPGSQVLQHLLMRL